MNTNRTLGILIALALVVPALPVVSAFDTSLIDELVTRTDDVEVANCSGNPCAATKCTKADASAHAVGNEHAWASAKSDVTEQSNDGVGTVSAEAPGSPNEASAKGKKNWSLKEANSSCKHGGKDDVAVPSFRGLTVGAITAASLPAFDDIAVGCVADDRITTSEVFAGQFYVDEEGTFYLYDAARAEGLIVPNLDITIDGTTLAGAEALDVTGMTAIDAGLTVTLHDGGDDADKNCAVTLWE